MNLIGLIKSILLSKHPHFISVDSKIYNKWKFFINLSVKLNKNYKSVEIFRKKFKLAEDFVVVGLKFGGKNVRRRTVGFAKGFLDQNGLVRCLYCDRELNSQNATADHIIPISKGGNNTKVNLVVVCEDCNSQRGNLEFRKFLRLKNPKYHNIKEIYI